MLDALFPPANPDQLIADMNAVGAQACLVYCWRPGGIGSWTPAHVSKLLSAGKLVAASVVPFPGGGPVVEQLNAVRAMGIAPPSPVSADLEPPGLPPSSWEEAFDAEVRARGYKDFDYGTSGNLGLYQPDPEGQWLASWLRTGVLNPIPSLPGGRYSAWQFVNDVPINGTQYDVSVVSQGVFTGVGSLGGSNSYMYHPTIPGRIDDFVVGTNDAIYHLFGVLLGNPGSYPSIEWWGSPGGSISPGSIFFGWSPDGQHLICRIVRNDDGVIFYRQMNVSGALELDWTPAAGATAMSFASTQQGPPGAVGPQGPPGPVGAVDAAQVTSLVKADLQKAASSL
jgi:hypothetical protein